MFIAGQHVVVEVAGRRFAVGTDEVSALVPARELPRTRVPDAPASLAGVINHRGTILPVIDLRTAIGLPALSEEVSALRQMLTDREQDHVDWLEALRRSVHTGESFRKPTDPRKCAFGQWYETLLSNATAMAEVTKDSMAVRATIEEFDGPHQRIHAIARECLELAAAEKIDEANARLDVVWNHDLAAMRRLFTRLVAEFEQATQPMICIVEQGADRWGLIVDRVDHIIQIAEDQVQEVPAGIECGSMIQHIWNPGDGGVVNILDLRAVRNTARLAAA